MIRLVKGAKETFGWVIVGENRELVIPPDAWQRYGFELGEEAIFTRSSKKSGGFGLTNHQLLEQTSLSGGENLILGKGKFAKNREVIIPETIPVNPKDKLLTVFGSGFALGFITKGAIFDEACKHPELPIFTIR